MSHKLLSSCLAAVLGLVLVAGCSDSKKDKAQPKVEGGGDPKVKGPADSAPKPSTID